MMMMMKESLGYSASAREGILENVMRTQVVTGGRDSGSHAGQMVRELLLFVANDI